MRAGDWWNFKLLKTRAAYLCRFLKSGLCIATLSNKTKEKGARMKPSKVKPLVNKPPKVLQTPNSKKKPRDPVEVSIVCRREFHAVLLTNKNQCRCIVVCVHWPKDRPVYAQRPLEIPLCGSRTTQWQPLSAE